MGVYRNTLTELECELPDDSIEAYPPGQFVRVADTADEVRAREIAEARANKVELDYDEDDEDDEPEQGEVVESGTLPFPADHDYEDGDA